MRCGRRATLTGRRGNETAVYKNGGSGVRSENLARPTNLTLPGAHPPRERSEADAPDYACLNWRSAASKIIMGMSLTGRGADDAA